MRRVAMLAVLVVGCVPMPQDRQAVMVRSSSDGATEFAMLVPAVEFPEYGCSSTVHFGGDSYSRLWMLAGVGFEADAGGAAVVASMGVEFPWTARDPIQTRVDVDFLLFDEHIVYEVGLSGAIDDAEAVKVRARGGVGIAF